MTMAVPTEVSGRDRTTPLDVAKVRADAYGELFSPDLNGDGYSDMVIYYPESNDRRGMVQVLMNQRRIQ